jgi:hypothetical protein
VEWEGGFPFDMFVLDVETVDYAVCENPLSISEVKVKSN